MKINLVYLKDIVSLIEALEKVDSAAEFLYTKGPVIVTDEGSQQFHIEWDTDGYWYLDTDKSKDIE